MAKKKKKEGQQIVDKCNALARLLYQYMGYEVRRGYRFDKALYPQEASLWNQAAMAYEFITGIDPNDHLEDEA